MSTWITKDCKIKSIEIGDRVQKLGVPSDINSGRVGTVIEFDDFGEKAKVAWDNVEGLPNRYAATWVTINSSRGLKKVE